MIKKAMILAAGFGKRIHPLTLKCPKPLLKIGAETLLSNTLKFLEAAKIDKVVINVHYLPEQIVDYIDKKNFNISITVEYEKETILDTGGGILNAIKHFDGNFLCINPDTIWNLNYLQELKKMENLFNTTNAKLLMLVVNKRKSFDKSFKGDFNLKDNLINREKNENLNYIYTGLQIINPEIFTNINKKIFSINEIWNKLIKKGEVLGIESNIDFLHISNLDIYKKLSIK